MVKTKILAPCKIYVFSNLHERSVLSRPSTPNTTKKSPSEQLSSVLDPLTVVDNAAELQGIYIVKNDESIEC